MPKRYFEHRKEDNLNIITIFYNNPGIRNAAFSACYIKTEKGIEVYNPIFTPNLKPIKIFKKEKYAIKFCKKTLEERLKKHIES